MKKWNLYLFFVSIVLICSCDWELHKVHTPLHTESISESKKVGVYIKSYQPTFVQINDSIQFHIKEAWCEKTFYYDDIDKNGILKNDYKRKIFHTVFTTNEKLEEKYKGLRKYGWWFDDFEFYTKNKYNYYFYSYKGKLSDTIEIHDTLEIKLVYDIFSKETDEFVETLELGKFYLYRDTLKYP